MIRLALIAFSILLTKSTLAQEFQPLGQVIENRNGDQLSAFCSAYDLEQKCAEVSIVLKPASQPAQTLADTSAKNSLTALQNYMVWQNLPHRIQITPYTNDLVIGAIVFPFIVVVIPFTLITELITYPVRGAIVTVKNMKIRRRVRLGKQALSFLFDQKNAGKIKSVRNRRFNWMVQALHTLP